MSELYPRGISENPVDPEQVKAAGDRFVVFESPWDEAGLSIPEQDADGRPMDPDDYAQIRVGPYDPELGMHVDDAGRRELVAKWIYEGTLSRNVNHRTHARVYEEGRSSMEFHGELQVLEVVTGNLEPHQIVSAAISSRRAWARGEPTTSNPEIGKIYVGKVETETGVKGLLHVAGIVARGEVVECEASQQAEERDLTEVGNDADPTQAAFEISLLNGDQTYEHTQDVEPVS